MRIDPKHFNKFISFCAAVTVVVILFSTIHYSQKQTADFKNKIDELDFNNLSFHSYSEQDTLHISELADSHVVIHFWSTWSGKSQSVNQFLSEYSNQRDDLYVIAASVRDGESQIMDYINSNRFTFHFVEGTDFFHSVYAPGIPTQIILNRDGTLHSSHVGDDIEELQNLLNRLL